MSHTCATQERVTEDWTLPNISEVLEGFPGYGDESHQDDIFKPIFFAIFGQHRLKHGLPHVLIKPVGK